MADARVGQDAATRSMTQGLERIVLGWFVNGEAARTRTVAARVAVVTCGVLWVLILALRQSNWALGPALPLLTGGVVILMVLASSATYREIWER